MYFRREPWERVARNTELAYPENGIGIGIGPIDGEAIPVSEMDYKTGQMRLTSADGRIILDCESSDIMVTVSDAIPPAL